MAFGAVQKYPVEVTSSLRPQNAVGVAIPFNGTAIFKPTFTTRDQLKSNLVNFFLTTKGSRVFNPTFGSNIRQYVFEQINEGNFNALENLIQSELQQNFANVRVENLEIYGSEDNNQIQIILTYSIKIFVIYNDQITIVL